MNGGLNLASWQPDQAACCTSMKSLTQLFSERNARRRRPQVTPVDGWIKEEDIVRPREPGSLPPEMDPLPQSTDALLAKELFRLSLEDRNKVLEEIHGVERQLDQIENESEIQTALKEMETELEKAPSQSSYARAKMQNPSYVSDRDFGMKFLRAENYDARGAAHRMLAFFEYKRELFGAEKLTRDIQIWDLLDNPEDKEALESGLFQLLSLRDRSGRLVMGKFHHPKFRTLSLTSRLRVYYYMLMTTTERENDQRRGVVWLIVDQVGITNRLDAWRNTTLLAALPVRLNALHVTHNDPKVQLLCSLAMLAMGPSYRARFRVHEGSTIENIYKISTFGISSKSIPVHPSTDDVRVDALFRWIEERKVIERRAISPMDSKSVDTNSSDKMWITAATETDVIFGRGKGVQNHPGNIRLRELIDSHRELYESARLSEKTFIAERIIKHIQNMGGRFLKRVDDGWEEVDDNVAREKISHTFRDRRRKSIKQQSDTETFGFSQNLLQG